MGPGQVGPSTGSWGWSGGRRRGAPRAHPEPREGLSAAHPFPQPASQNSCPPSPTTATSAPPRPLQKARASAAGPEGAPLATGLRLTPACCSDRTALCHPHPPLPGTAGCAPERACTRRLVPPRPCGEQLRKHSWGVPSVAGLACTGPRGCVSHLSVTKRCPRARGGLGSWDSGPGGG